MKDIEKRLAALEANKASLSQDPLQTIDVQELMQIGERLEMGEVLSDRDQATLDELQSRIDMHNAAISPARYLEGITAKELARTLVTVRSKF